MLCVAVSKPSPESTRPKSKVSTTNPTNATGTKPHPSGLLPSYQTAPWEVQAASSFAGRQFAAQLAEEIEDEADLDHSSVLFCARGLQHVEAFAVGMQVERLRASRRVGKLAGRPEQGAKMCASGERYFFKPVLQLRTTVIGADAPCSGAVLIRKRWPSGDTSYE